MNGIDFNALAVINMGLIHAPVLGGELPPMEGSSQRIIVGKNGVFIQYTSNWLQVIKKVGEVEANIPYGTVEEKIELRFKKFPREMIEAFHEQAKEAFPNEAFAYIHWNSERNKLKLVPGVVLEASDHKITYGRVEIEQGWQCIGDIHSHPNDTAFYSGIDNEDDRSGVKCSFVIGLSADKSMNSFIGRFCVFGSFALMENGMY